MTTYVAARGAVIGLIDAAWAAQYPSVSLYHENTESVDLDKVGDRFLRVWIDFDDARQMTINNNPHHETYGTLRLSIFTKEGLGTLVALGMMDFLANLAKFKTSNGVTFSTPTPGRKEGKNGWVSQDLLIPFKFNTIT